MKQQRLDSWGTLLIKSWELFRTNVSYQKASRIVLFRGYLLKWKLKSKINNELSWRLAWWNFPLGVIASTISHFLSDHLRRNLPSLFCQTIINKAACQEESLWNSAVAMFVTMSPSTSKFFVPWCIVAQNTKFLCHESGTLFLVTNYFLGLVLVGKKPSGSLKM